MPCRQLTPPHTCTQPPAPAVSPTRAPTATTQRRQASACASVLALPAINVHSVRSGRAAPECPCATQAMLSTGPCAHFSGGLLLLHPSDPSLRSAPICPPCPLAPPRTPAPAATCSHLLHPPAPRQQHRHWPGHQLPHRPRLLHRLCAVEGAVQDLLCAAGAAASAAQAAAPAPWGALAALVRARAGAGLPAGCDIIHPLCCA